MASTYRLTKRTAMNASINQSSNNINETYDTFDDVHNCIPFLVQCLNSHNPTTCMEPLSKGTYSLLKGCLNGESMLHRNCVSPKVKQVREAKGFVKCLPLGEVVFTSRC